MSIESNQVKRCCICGETFIGWGNNPWPVCDGENDRCCDACNEEKVIPERLGMMFNGGNKSNE